MRLRMGRFARELYYTRGRAVLPREEVRRRVALACGHLGYVTGLFEYIMTDMLLLRAFAVTGCVLIVGYQVAQPRIQMVTTFWNSAFAVLNLYQIHALVRRLPAMSDEEVKLFEALGGEARLKQRSFQELLEVGVWRFLEAGEKLAQEGMAAEAPEVCLLASGSCDVQFGGLITGRLGPGSVIGEVWALAPEAPEERSIESRTASATVAAGGMGARCFCLPLAQLQALPELREALHEIFAGALGERVRHMHVEHRLLQYKAVLEVACAAGPDPPHAVLAAIAGFRQKHGVTEDDHFRATQAVPRCVSSKLIRAF